MEDKRPNIVMIITDQQRYDTINALGFAYMKTPNLDDLVHRGVHFTNQFVTAPSCAPARASLFTGLYPHTTGVYKNGDLWRHSWIENLARTGYHCANIGKMHTTPFETPLGFHERFVVENKDRFLQGQDYVDQWDMALHQRGLEKQRRVTYRKYPDYAQRVGAFEWELPEEMHSDFFVGDLACWWIEKYNQRRPFFLEIGFPGPHPPYDPVPRYIDLYSEADIPLPEVTEDELSRQPPAHHEMRRHNNQVDHDSITWPLTPHADQLRRLRKHYFANVTMIDEKIGSILSALDQRGFLENSLVIFTSDHGDCLGDHGQIQKWTMFDTVVRTPLIVWQPGVIEGGRSADQLCQQFDIVPVILATAQAEPAGPMETRDVFPLLRGAATGEFRDYVFAEQVRDDNLTGTEAMIMARSREWKLVHYLDDRQQGELYDLVSDPGEVRNLWHQPEHRDKKAELRSVLLDWYIESLTSTAEFAASIR